jgi:magnesium transporter
MVKELFDLKKEIIQVKKNTWPLRDMVSGIQRDENSLFNKDPKNSVYIRDLLDHVNYITESSDNLRDGVYSLVEMHTNFVGMRMNEIMRVLTVITTIFAPIMFIASIYGMNFDIPELHLKYGYMLFWGVVAVLTLLQWRYYKKKRWI